MAAAAAALILANSPASGFYTGFFQIELAHHSLLHWINDGLMALFFLLIGLELKREFVAGELSTAASRILPGAAAVAGMVVPALIYLAVNHDAPQNHRGWAIPAATDIAFALGVLALLGSRVPTSLKVLVTAIAIIDDLGAIGVIAVAYTDHIDLAALGLAAAGLTVLAACNRLRVTVLWPYLLVGAGVWYAVLQSGVHATLAGVAVAMTIPLRVASGREAPLLRLEHRLSPWSALLIVPLFGFANAGVDMRGLGLPDLLAPLPVGIALGLVLGKQLGIFVTLFVMVRFGLAPRPDASWRQVWGATLLCGIGFTMSLFIAGLAFPAGADAAKLGILGGSLFAALAGYAVLASGKTEQQA